MSAFDRPKHPDQPTTPWQVEIADNATFWRSAREDAQRNGIAVITGLAGGPVIILGSQVRGAEGLQPGWLTMREAASRFGHGYFWFSRRWKKVFRLKPRRSGRVLLFSQAQIDAVIEQRLPHAGCRGRAKKVVAIIPHGQV